VCRHSKNVGNPCGKGTEVEIGSIESQGQRRINGTEVTDRRYRIEVESDSDTQRIQVIMDGGVLILSVIISSQVA
jgi:hypothetical protein